MTTYFKYFLFIICVRMVDGWEDVQQISENEMVDGDVFFVDGDKGMRDEMKIDHISSLSLLSSLSPSTISSLQQRNIL